MFLKFFGGWSFTPKQLIPSATRNTSSWSFCGNSRSCTEKFKSSQKHWSVFKEKHGASSFTKSGGPASWRASPSMLWRATSVMSRHIYLPQDPGATPQASPPHQQRSICESARNASGPQGDRLGPGTPRSPPPGGARWAWAWPPLPAGKSPADSLGCPCCSGG